MSVQLLQFINLPEHGAPGGFDHALPPLETVFTEKGDHTFAFGAWRSKVHAFLLQAHRAQVFTDG